MRDALKSYLALASGVTDVTRQRALAAARALVSQGEATAEQVTGLAEDLVAQARQNREAVVSLVGFEVDRALARVGLATADEVTALREQVRALEEELHATALAVGTGSAAGERTAAPESGSLGGAVAAPAATVQTSSAPGWIDGSSSLQSSSRRHPSRSTSMIGSIPASPPGHVKSQPSQFWSMPSARPLSSAPG